MSHYERERRDRESEREQLYRRRADPRGSLDELPYGDERPSGASRRRRADSPVDSEGSARMAKVRYISHILHLYQRALWKFLANLSAFTEIEERINTT